MSNKTYPTSITSPSSLTDGHGRTVSYLRLSVTDRCNLRCRYCMAPDVRFITHDHILRYEELLRLVGVARELGVQKVRLTGGEPLARRDFVPFVNRLHERFPDMDVRITTNATLLPGKVDALAQAGVRRLNISLDTLDRARFAEITGQDLLGNVRQAIDEALAAGVRVKINAVAMRGFNDVDLPGFLALAREHPLDVRFIEFMPMGGETSWNENLVWTASEIAEEAGRHVELIPLERDQSTDGPARMFAIAGGKGRLGLISPLSNHFCSTCNRLRITPDGRLRTCLFSDREYRLRPLLRNPRLGDDAIVRVLTRAGRSKPIGHEILAARQRLAVAQRHMSAIGG